jgi:hypothetical protein
MTALSLTEALPAYLSTDYIVLDGKRRITARIHRLNPDLDALLERHGAAEGVFITAWNPRSVKATTTANQAAHARLQEVLEDEDLSFLPHEGRSHEGRGGDWVEQGFLILDLPPFDALQLAEMFGQNAIVWQALGQPAHLLFTALALADLAQTD